MNISIKYSGILLAILTLHSGFAEVIPGIKAGLAASSVEMENDDLEIDPVPLTFDWLRFGFDPRGPAFAKPEPSSLFSCSLEGGVGYRNDQFHWTTSVPQFDIPQYVDSNIKYTNIATVELLAKLYIGNLFFSVLGDWGWVCSGKDSITAASVIPTPPPTAHFHSDVDGHVEDYVVGLGYYVKLYSGQKNRFYLTPQAGYQWNFQHYHDVHIKPSSAATEPSFGAGATDLHLSYQTSSPKVKWNGPFAGLAFLFQLQKVDLELGGTYEWLEQHFDNKINPVLKGESGGLPVIANTHSHFRGHFHTRYAYSAFLKLNYHLTAHWLFGFNASFRQAKVENENIKDHVNIVLTMGGVTQQLTDQVVIHPSTNRWQSWAGYLTAAYLF